ncbi:MAG: DnaJ domain-containing protein [Chitinophagaceae bacterium]
MAIKDYYKILQVDHTAGLHEIKKAYRGLAMKYHPDKNGDNQLAGAHFREIQEAYHILSDSGRRSAYNQQRWYSNSMRTRSAPQPVSPQLILTKCKQLSQYVHRMNAFNLNQQSLSNYIIHLLSETSLEILINLNDTLTNRQIITEVLQASDPLSFKYLQKVALPLVRLAGSDKKTVETINGYVQERKLAGYWKRYQVLFIFLLTLIICWIIYEVS